MMYQVEYVERGWECPKCGHVYSPKTTMCLVCPMKDATATNVPDSAEITWITKQFGATVPAASCGVEGCKCGR